MPRIPTGRFWTIPNLLSLSRLALLPLWWWLMASVQTYHHVWGGLLVVYGIISDAADGFLARRLNQVSEWGKILDPVGDKVAAFVAALFCVFHRGLPWPALTITVIRDLGLMIGGLVVYRRDYEVPVSINLGRYAALGWGITILLYVFDLQPFGSWVLWPSVLLYLAAGVSYWRRTKGVGYGSGRA